MPKKQKETAVDNEQTVSYKDVVYKASELSPVQIDNFNHMADLKRKIDQATFNVRQLQGGMMHFEYELDKSLKKGKDDSE
tara:strand:+ start:206 stop:445 length:240 start_codon:yes stop_codon:yes gene_type:complete